MGLFKKNKKKEKKAESSFGHSGSESAVCSPFSSFMDGIKIEFTSTDEEDEDEDED